MLDTIFDYLHFNVRIETLIVLLILVFLEAVLSADNAIALAAIAQGLENKELERKALNIGLIFAYVLRIILLFAASWVQKFWQFELLGGVYLLWLVFQHFTSTPAENEEAQNKSRFKSLWNAIPIIAFTDLAFSLDSVATAIAVSQEMWLVFVGTTIGIVTLRFMAGLFIEWLDIFDNLKDAGYITVSFVGLRLLLKVINQDLVPPEWVMICAIIVILAWGFSKRTVSFEVVAEKKEKSEVVK
jgi:YkoY family integral membrane protein